MAGGLFDPLGTDRDDFPQVGGRPSAAAVAAGLTVAAVAALFAVSWWRDDGDRGRPVAVAPIEHVRAAPKPPTPPPIPTASPAAAPQAATPGPTAAGLPPVRDDQEVEIQNGVRIVRPRRDGSAPGGQTIRVPDARAPR